ncbi:hypothetical protein [Paenibacillus koleovorans]|uniref:hypothetical protein n=1 Tax=Paenibacillus koleovorans TaxID=121608 RepID=UPI000FD8F7B2|nr:hypothetical protein [Paenibacillus koleovorans]
MAAKGKTKKKAAPTSGGSYQLRTVTSDICEVCKTPCARGMRYAARMREPGAVGKGVPCILTRYKA